MWKIAGFCEIHCFSGGGSIFSKNFWSLFFRSRCRISWSNVTILGLQLVLGSTMRKMERVCIIHVFRGEGPDFRSKFLELLFFRSRCCISWSNFIIFSFWLAIWWIMRNIKGYCEICVFRGEGPDFRTKFPKLFFCRIGCISGLKFEIICFSKFLLVDNEGYRSI